MTAANCADIFANELLRSAHIHDLQIRVVQPRHHLFGRDRYCRIDFQFERDGRKLRGVTADRPAGGGPVLDAIMVDTDIAAAEILQGVKTEIGIPRAAAAVHDGFAIRVQTRRAEYLLDAVRRDEILGIFVAQNFRRIADADGARNVSFGICIGSSYVPNNGISRDSLGDIVAIDDGGGRGQGGLRPQERKRNEYQTFHDEPSVSSLLSSELSKTVYHLRVRVSSSNPINLGRAGPRTKVGNGSIASFGVRTDHFRSSPESRQVIGMAHFPTVGSIAWLTRFSIFLFPSLGPLCTLLSNSWARAFCAFGTASINSASASLKPEAA